MKTATIVLCKSYSVACQRGVIVGICGFHLKGAYVVEPLLCCKDRHSPERCFHVQMKPRNKTTFKLRPLIGCPIGGLNCKVPLYNTLQLCSSFTVN